MKDKKLFIIKKENNKTNCTFVLGVVKGLDVPLFVLTGFGERETFHQETQKDDTFYQLSVSNAQCNIDIQKNT